MKRHSQRSTWPHLRSAAEALHPDHQAASAVGDLGRQPPTITRRRFLNTLGTTAAAAGMWTCARQTAAGQSASWTLRLAASSINFQGLPIEQACERIAALGFEAVDIWSAHNGCPHLDDVLDRLGPDGLRRLLIESRLALCSFSVYQGGYPRYAKLLGGVGGGIAVRGSTQPCPPAELGRRMREFLESLQPEVELAEQYNSRIAIENHGSALLDSLDSLKAFVDTNRSPRLGIALAPYHLQVLNASVEEAIGICGEQLLFFYAWQHADDTAQLPGRGPTDFTPWMNALAKTNYGGYVTPFMHGDLKPTEMASALAASRDYLIRCHNP